MQTPKALSVTVQFEEGLENATFRFRPSSLVNGGPIVEYGGSPLAAKFILEELPFLLKPEMAKLRMSIVALFDTAMATAGLTNKDQLLEMLNMLQQFPAGEPRDATVTLLQELAAHFDTVMACRKKD